MRAPLVSATLLAILVSVTGCAAGPGTATTTDAGHGSGGTESSGIATPDQADTPEGCAKLAAIGESWGAHSVARDDDLGNPELAAALPAPICLAAVGGTSLATVQEGPVLSYLGLYPIAYDQVAGLLTPLGLIKNGTSLESSGWDDDLSAAEIGSFKLYIDAASARYSGKKEYYGAPDTGEWVVLTIDRRVSE
ncbi:hypothetical protein BH09ACT3_BH09ACT3_05880 [soil metagenome]